MECKKEKINCLDFPSRITGEAAAEGEVILPDYCPNIMRLVRTQARTYITSKAPRADKYAIEGYVEFTVLYTSEEDGKIKSIMHSLPFSYTFDTEVDENTYTFLRVRTVSASARALSPQKVWLRAVFAPELTTAKSQQWQIVCPDGASAGVWIRKDQATTASSLTCKGQKPVRITDEIATAPKKCDKILGYEVMFTPTDKKLLTGKMIAKADMTMKINFADMETGAPSTIEKTVPVSQAVDLAGAEDDTLCDVEYSLRDCKFEVTESGDGTTISYEAEVNAEVQGLKNAPVTCCSDAFSETEDLKPVYCEISTAGVQSVGCSGSLRQSIDTGYFDRIYCMNVNPVVRSETLDPEYGAVKVAGDIICSVILCDAEKDVSCVERSFPFSFNVPVSCCGEEIMAAAEMSVRNSAYVENDSKSLEVRVDWCYSGLIFCGGKSTVLTDIQSEGEAQTGSRSEIIVYFAEKDEDVWNIAKKYRVSPDKLCSANGVDGNIKENRTLMI